MLTEIELKIINFITYFATKIYCFPIDWLPNKLITRSKSRLKYNLCYLNFSTNLFYGAILILRLVPGLGYNYKSGNVKELGKSLNFHLLNLLIQLACSGIHICGFAYTEEIVDWYNQILYFNIKDGKHHFNQKCFPPCRREKAFKILVYVLVAVGATTMPLIFPAMHNYQYFIYSLVPENYKTVSTFLIFTLIETFYIYKALVFHLFVVALTYLQIFTFKFWIVTACGEWLIESKPNFTQKPSTKILETLQKLQLLVGLWNKSMALMLGSFQQILFLAIIIFLYGSLRLYDSLPIPLYIVDVVFAIGLIIEQIVCISQMATIHEKSNKVKHDLLQRFSDNDGNYSIRTKEYAIIKRCVLGTKSIKFELGLFYVKKSTKLTMFGFVLSAATYALLTLK